MKINEPLSTLPENVINIYTKPFELLYSKLDRQTKVGSLAEVAKHYCITYIFIVTKALSPLFFLDKLLLITGHGGLTINISFK